MSPARRRSGEDSRSRSKSRSKRKNRRSRSRSRDQRRSSRRERSKSRSRTRDRRKKTRSKSPEPPKPTVRKSRFSAAPIEAPSRPPPGVAGGNNANLVPVAPRKTKTQSSDPAESKAKYETLQEKLLRLSQKSKPLGAGGAAAAIGAQGMPGSGYAAPSTGSVGAQELPTRAGSRFSAAPASAQGTSNTESGFTPSPNPSSNAQVVKPSTGSRFSAAPSESFGVGSASTESYSGSYAGGYPSSAVTGTERSAENYGQQQPYGSYPGYQYQPPNQNPNEMQGKATNAPGYDGCPFTNDSGEPLPPGHEPEEQEPPPPGHEDDEEPLPPGQSEPHSTHWTPNTTSAPQTSTNKPPPAVANPYQYGDYASMAQAAAAYGNMAQPPQGTPYNYNQPPPMWPPPQAPGGYPPPSWGGEAPTMEGIPSKGLWQPPTDNQKPPLSPTSERLSKVWAGVGGRSSPTKITMDIGTAETAPVGAGLEIDKRNSKSPSKEDIRSVSQASDDKSKESFQEEIMRTIQKKRETIAMSLSDSKSVERSNERSIYQHSNDQHKSRNRSTSKPNERRRSPFDEHPASSSRSTSRDREPDKSRSNSKVKEKLMKLSATIEEDEKESFSDNQADKVPFVRAEKKVGLLAGKIKDKLKSPEKDETRRLKSRGRGSKSRSPRRRSGSRSKKNEVRRKHSRSRSRKRLDKPNESSKSHRRKSRSASRSRKQRSKSRPLQRRSRSRSRRRSKSMSKSRRRRSRSQNKRADSRDKNRTGSKDRKVNSKGRSHSRDREDGSYSKSRKKNKRSHSRPTSPHSAKRSKINEDFREEKFKPNRDHDKYIDNENNSVKYDDYKESKRPLSDLEENVDHALNNDDKDVKKKKKKDKKKKRKKKKSGSSSSDSESSDDGSKKKKKKKDKKKKSKKSKKDPKEQLEELTASIAELERKAHMDPEAESELEKRAQLAPMTKEAWEKKQSSVRREFDEDTGRMRLVRGGGEILEECVSKDRMKEINRQATKADGDSFQRDLKNKLGE